MSKHLSIAIMIVDTLTMGGGTTSHTCIYIYIIYIYIIIIINIYNMTDVYPLQI